MCDCESELYLIDFSEPQNLRKCLLIAASNVDRPYLQCAQHLHNMTYNLFEIAGTQFYIATACNHRLLSDSHFISTKFKYLSEDLNKNIFSNIILSATRLGSHACMVLWYLYVCCHLFVSHTKWKNVKYEN